MLCIRPRERTLPEALALAETSLNLATERNTPVLAANVVNGRAVVLGAMQRTGRVIDAQACDRAGASVLRRMTTGTAAWIDGPAIVLALALPHVAALYADATNRTLLNRNVRPFLRGFTRAGAMAHYFGREWISLRKRPAALLGFEVTRSGAVLIEVFLGGAQAIGLPVALQTVQERAIDRFMGKTPAGLQEIVPEVQLGVFLERFVENFGDSSAISMVDVPEVETPLWMRQTGEMDPWPVGAEPKVSMRVPIGYLELVFGGLAGDVLAPRWLYADVGSRANSDKLVDVPIEGATLQDMRRVVDDVIVRRR